MNSFRACALLFLVSFVSFVPAPAVAQTAALMPTPRFQALDANGYPLAGGFVYTYVAGTTTPLASYTNAAGTVANPNPVVLDASGAAAIWLARSSTYKVIVQDSSHTQIYSTDNVPGDSSGAQAGKGQPNGYASLDSSGFVPQAQLAYAGQDGTTRTIATKLGVTRDVKADFGAVGDNATDDTAKLQACFTWAGSTRGSCYLPPAIYKVTGSGLTIPNGATVRSDAPVGQGTADLRYYGTGSAVTIGTGSGSFVYAVTLQNVFVTVAPAVTAAYGINVQGLSEAHWYGVGISGNSTGGQFTTALRLSDANGLTIDGLTISNREGAGFTATTAVLYDEVGGLGYGNNAVTINHADIFFAGKFFDVKSCDACRILDAINLEGFDYLLNIDTTGNVKTNDYVSMRFENNQVSADEAAYFSNRKAANINAAASKPIYLYGLNFTGNVMQFASGVTNPLVLTVSASVGSYIMNLQMENNILRGANGAVVGVTSPGPFARLRFGYNYAYSNTGTVRTPDVVAYSSSTAYLIDEALPMNSTGQALAYKDLNGVEYLAGSSSSSMTRPAAGALVPGALYGVDVGLNLNSNGFVRVGASGGAQANLYGTYCDWSASSSVPDMHRTMVCFAGGAEMFRLDPATGIKLTGATSSTGTVTAPGFTAGSSPGLTVVKNLTGSGGTACTQTFTGGLLTASTCP